MSTHAARIARPTRHRATPVGVSRARGSGPGDLGEVLTLLASDLVGFQNTRCAADFLDAVAAVHGAEERVAPGSTRLTEAVARGLHRLTAYKDKYEVVRLLVGPEARAAAESVGGPGARAIWHLHPPLLQALGMDGKLRLPAGVGRPVMRLMAAGRRLRGTPSTRSDAPRWGA